jgi:hypothetical protein
MGRPSHTWKDYINVDLKEIMFEGLHWTVTQYGDQWQDVVN